MKIEFNNLNIQKIILLILLLIIIDSPNILADGNVITVCCDSKWKVGKSVDIIIDSNIAENIYSGQISIDSMGLEVIDILPGRLLSNIEKSDFCGEQGGHKIYYFSCLGNKKGVNGKGELFVIKAKILESYPNINTDNLYITLYSNNNGVEEIKYSLKNNIKVKDSFIYSYERIFKEVGVALIGSFIITLVYYIYQKCKSSRYMINN